MSITLYAGWNYDVRYTGITQSAEAAFASILPYLIAVYYWNGSAYVTPTTMVTGNDYLIKVSQDCVWTFEMPAVVPCEITITAPSSAVEGGTVNVSVKIKNVSAYNYSYKATIYAVPDLYPDYVIGSIDQVITSGSSVTRSASVTMPDCNVTILVWVERWAATAWVYDNSASKVVSLEVPATYHLSVLVPSWAAGGYVDPGSGDYPAYSTVALTAHPLSGYQFTGWGGDASGTALTYDLYMNSDKNVEAYFEPVPVPEYKGSIARKELEYDSVRGTIPVY